MDVRLVRNNQFYLERQAQYESNARSYPRRIPIALTSASGCYVTDADGKTYLDCLAGAGTLALGHNHPEILETMQAILKSGLPLHSLDFATPVKDQFASDLLKTLPPALVSSHRIQFCSPTGSDAVEAAIKLAKTVTGRSDIICFRGAYHGMSQGTLALTGSLAPKHSLGLLAAGTHFFPYPYAFRCPFGRGGEHTATLCAEYFENALRDPESGINLPAAVILEVVQGEGGVIPAPDSWLQSIRRITRELNIPLIIDEVQTGCGRTGTFYAFQKSGIMPDILCLSKAIGGGLPLAVVVYREELDLWKPGAHAGTFRGNVLAMAAGSKTLEIIQRDGLAKRAKIAGARLKECFEQLKVLSPHIGDVRGEGLMLGIEIVDPTTPLDALGHHAAAAHTAAWLQRQLLEAGLIVETGGRFASVLRFLPPLIISEEEINRISDLLLSVVKNLGRTSV